MGALAVAVSLLLIANPLATPVADPVAAPAPTPSAAPPGDGEPRPAAFTSEFSGSDLPGGCTAFDGSYGEYGSSIFRPDEVRVAGGLLRLRLQARSYQGSAFTGGGIGCRRATRRYGRYEFRLKPPLGAGLTAYVVLRPERLTANDMLQLEFVPRPGVEQLYLSNGYGPGATEIAVPGRRFSDGFHTYVIEWAPGSVRVLMDGEPLLDDPHASAVPRGLEFALATGALRAGGLDPATRLPAELQVDWVRVGGDPPDGATLPVPTETSAVAAGQPVAGGPGPALPVWPFAVGAAVLTLLALGLAVARRFIR